MTEIAHRMCDIFGYIIAFFISDFMDTARAEIANTAGAEEGREDKTRQDKTREHPDHTRMMEFTK
jgi:hypothetical protein